LGKVAENLPKIILLFYEWEITSFPNLRKGEWKKGVFPNTLFPEKVK
jgi:hypothetical protein